METLTTDRCDRCNAATAVYASFEEGDNTLVLGFCQHHMNRYEVALVEDGWLIMPDRRPEWSKS